jgi:Trypsin-like peptidase domain/Effector-associated domain 1
MEIDGKKRKQIREALLDGLATCNALAMFTDDILNEKLQNITSLNKDMPTMAYDLIGWAQARGRLAELVLGAASERPQNAKLKLVAGQFRFATEAMGEPESMIFEEVGFENIGDRLDKMSRYRRAVCRIEPKPNSTTGRGSGFLVGPRLVMTNHHVVRPFLAQGADQVVVRFDYEGQDAAAAEAKSRKHTLATNEKWLVKSSGEDQLDFALIRLNETAAKDAAPGGERGFLTPVGQPLKKDRPLVIVQHPAGTLLKLAIGSIVDPDSIPNRVCYNVNTEGGSSGSPCFSSSLAVVAIHHWGNVDHNRGVRMAPILKEIGAAPSTL